MGRRLSLRQRRGGNRHARRVALAAAAARGGRRREEVHEERRRLRGGGAARRSAAATNDRHEGRVAVVAAIRGAGRRRPCRRHGARRRRRRREQAREGRRSEGPALAQRRLLNLRGSVDHSNDFELLDEEVRLVRLPHAPFSRYRCRLRCATGRLHRSAVVRRGGDSNATVASGAKGVDRLLLLLLRLARQRGRILEVAGGVRRSPRFFAYALDRWMADDDVDDRGAALGHGAQEGATVVAASASAAAILDVKELQQAAVMVRMAARRSHYRPARVAAVDLVGDRREVVGGRRRE